MLMLKTILFKIYDIFFCFRYLQTCLLQGLEKEPNVVPVENEDTDSKRTLGRDKSDMLLEVFESGEAGQKFEARMIDCFDDLINHLEL